LSSSMKRAKVGALSADDRSGLIARLVR